MRIDSRCVPSAWGADGGQVRLRQAMSKRFDTQLNVVVDLMIAAGIMPEFDEVAEVCRAGERAGVAIERVLTEGFEVVIDALREQIAAGGGERQVA